MQTHDKHIYVYFFWSEALPIKHRYRTTMTSRHGWPDMEEAQPAYDPAGDNGQVFERLWRIAAVERLTMKHVYKLNMKTWMRWRLAVVLQVATLMTHHAARYIYNIYIHIYIMQRGPVGWGRPKQWPIRLPGTGGTGPLEIPKCICNRQWLLACLIYFRSDTVWCSIWNASNLQKCTRLHMLRCLRTVCHCLRLLRMWFVECMVFENVEYLYIYNIMYIYIYIIYIYYM